MKEGHIEKHCKKLAENASYLVRKIEFIADTGCPDRLFLKLGHSFWVEFKSPTGQLSAKQVFTIKKLREAGQEVHVIDNIEDFKKVLK